jgi:protein-disulfide isomerase
VSSRNRFLVIGAVVLAVVVAAVVAGALVAAGGDDGDGDGGGGATTGVELAGAEETRALLQGIPQDGTAIGAPDAPVTLVEFADLQCPFCAQWATDAFPDLVEDYVRPGKLRIEFRGLTFIGPDSEKALRAALSAGEQDKLWETVELLYQNQGAENSGWVSDELLDAVATSAMLDAGLWRDGFDSDAVDQGIQAAAQEATTGGINSTPSFLLGPTGGTLERVEVQSLDADALRPAIEQALAG